MQFILLASHLFSEINVTKYTGGALLSLLPHHTSKHTHMHARTHTHTKGKKEVGGGDGTNREKKKNTLCPPQGLKNLALFYLNKMLTWKK